MDSQFILYYILLAILIIWIQWKLMEVAVKSGTVRALRQIEKEKKEAEKLNAKPEQKS